MTRELQCAPTGSDSIARLDPFDGDPNISSRMTDASSRLRKTRSVARAHRDMMGFEKGRVTNPVMWCRRLSSPFVLAVMCGCGASPANKPVESSASAAAPTTSERKDAPAVVQSVANDKRPANRDPVEVQTVVRANFAGIRACYAKALARLPTLTGRISMKLVIRADGSVANVTRSLTEPSPSHVEIDDAEMASCVTTAFAQLRFSSVPEGDTTIVYPLVFSPDSGDAGLARAAADVDRLRPAFKRCYEKGLASNAKLEGSVVIVARISAKGGVLSTAMDKVSGLDKDVVACIRQVTMSATFAQRPDDHTLNIPLRFKLPAD